MSPDDFASQLQLFHGEATVRLARIYAQLPAAPGYKLAGYLSGPHCLHSTTLPATIPFRDKGPGETLLAEAILPDPCFWSPEMPALYTAQVELRQADAVIATAQRTFGFRSLSIRGKSFYSEGRRVVLRGMHAATAGTGDLLAWRDVSATMLVMNPSDALCDEASRVGVLLLVLLADTDVTPDNLQRLSMHAAVGALFFTTGVKIDSALRQQARRMIFGYWLLPGEVPSQVQAADALLMNVGDPHHFASAASAFGKPVIALQQKPSAGELSIARSQCDELQAALAPYGDFAGYLV